MRALATIAALTSISAANAAIVKGTILDPDGEGLPQATVKLLSAADSSFVKGAKTNVTGAFTLAGVKAGKYIIEATYLG